MCMRTYICVCIYYTFDFVSQYFYKNNIFHHAWQDMNILGNPIIVLISYEYYHAYYIKLSMAL